MLYDGAVTLTDTGEGYGVAELTFLAPFEDAKKTTLTYDGNEYSTLSWYSTAYGFVGDSLAWGIEGESSSFMGVPPAIPVGEEINIKIMQEEDEYDVVFDGEVTVSNTTHIGHFVPEIEPSNNYVLRLHLNDADIGPALYVDGTTFTSEDGEIFISKSAEPGSEEYIYQGSDVYGVGGTYSLKIIQYKTKVPSM